MLWKERNVLFNNTLSTFYLYDVEHVEKDYSAREESCCYHYTYGLLFRLAARVLLCAPFHRQDNTYHSLCYTGLGVQDGMRSSSICPS